MSEIWILLVPPAITGVIVLLVEYWIIMPLKGRMNNDVNLDQDPQSAFPTNTLSNKETISPQFVTYYHRLAVGLLGVLSGVMVSIIIRMLAADYAPLHAEEFLGEAASLIATSDFLFALLIFCSAVGGGAISLAVDLAASDSGIVLWLRLVTAMVFGFVGGTLSFVVVLLIIIGIIVFSIFTELMKK